MSSRPVKAGEEDCPISNKKDTQIGAHAISLNVGLVTDNTTEFRRIKELKIESWLK
jgi:predicted nucleic acid-binding protein